MGSRAGNRRAGVRQHAVNIQRVGERNIGPQSLQNLGRSHVLFEPVDIEADRLRYLFDSVLADLPLRPRRPARAQCNEFQRRKAGNPWLSIEPILTPSQLGAASTFRL